MSERDGEAVIRSTNECGRGMRRLTYDGRNVGVDDCKRLGQ